MSKREKIILMITLISALYGLYSFLLASPSENYSSAPGESLAQLHRFTADLVNVVANEASADTDKYILARAASEWPVKPFLQSGLPAEPISTEKAADGPGKNLPAMELTYSGYLEMAGRQLAIINGIEYGVGEQLTQPGYIVQRISPISVLIEAVAEKNIIVLPLEETY